MLKINTVQDITEVRFNIQKLNLTVCETVKEGIQDLFDKPNAKVLINMNGVHFLDSSGFAMFLSATKVAGNNNGQIIFCNVCDSAMKLFMVLQLHTIFKIIDNYEEAIKSFK